MSKYNFSKALDDTLNVRMDKVTMTTYEPPQDTSLEDKHGKYLDDILWLLNPEQVDLTVKEAKHKILNLFSLQRAKLFEQIRSEVINMEYSADYTKYGKCDVCGDFEYSHSPDSHKDAGARELQALQLEALNRLELKNE